MMTEPHSITMITEPQQYHKDNRTTTVSPWWQIHNSITMVTEPQQNYSDDRTTTVSQR